MLTPTPLATVQGALNTLAKDMHGWLTAAGSVGLLAAILLYLLASHQQNGAWAQRGLHGAFVALAAVAIGFAAPGLIALAQTIGSAV